MRWWHSDVLFLFWNSTGANVSCYPSIGFCLIVIRGRGFSKQTEICFFFFMTFLPLMVTLSETQNYGDLSSDWLS